jgi:hypothetical protein
VIASLCAFGTVLVVGVMSYLAGDELPDMVTAAMLYMIAWLFFDRRLGGDR